MLTRRAALTALAGLAATRGARAQTFPSRPITIVVPYPAGGPVDVTARLIAQSVGNNLGQPIAVDNRGGGAGVIGSVAVQRAEPDGHTLILGTNQTHATNQSLLKNCPYDAVKDFAPVAGIADIPHVLVVRRGLEAPNVGALVQLAKKSPGQLNYASTGVGSASHLAAELFKTRAGVELAAHPVPRLGADDHRACWPAASISPSRRCRASSPIIDAGVNARARGGERKARRAAAEPADARGSRRARRRGRRLVRAVRAGEDARRDNRTALPRGVRGADDRGRVKEPLPRRA